jgi:hypothetical protein
MSQDTNIILDWIVELDDRGRAALASTLSLLEPGRGRSAVDRLAAGLIEACAAARGLETVELISLLGDIRGQCYGAVAVLAMGGLRPDSELRPPLSHSTRRVG